MERRRGVPGPTHRHDHGIRQVHHDHPRCGGGVRARAHLRDGQARARLQGKNIGRPQRQLTDYQREKIRRILEEEPDISNYRLAQQFEGISRNTLIKLAKEEGLLPHITEDVTDAA